MESGKKKNLLESIGRKRTTNVDEAGNKIAEELLKKCKPVSVSVTRLPVSVVNASVEISEAERKNRNRLRRIRHAWKNGYIRKRTRSRDRSQRRKDKLSDEKNKNIDQEKPKESKNISKNSFTENFNENKESSQEKTNKVNERQESNIEQSKAEGRKLILHVQETLLKESFKVLPIAAIETEEQKNNAEASKEISDNISDELLEKNDNSFERKNSLRHSTQKIDDNKTIEDSKKRKRSLQSIDDEIHERNGILGDAKKFKSSDIVSDEKILLEEKSIEKTSNDVVSITKQNKSVKQKNRNRKFIRRQENIKEVKITLTKLENSSDPFVLQWREKLGLDHSNVGETTCEENSKEKHNDDKTQSISIEESSKKVSLENNSNSVQTIYDTGPEIDSNVNTSLKSVRTVTEENNIRPLDKAAVSRSLLAEIDERSTIEDEKNDEEIMEFLRSPRKFRASIDSSSSESTSNYQETSKTPMLRRSARIHAVTPLIDSNSDSEEIPPTRVLRSHAKTPSIITERTRPETRMSRMLREADLSTIDNQNSISSIQEKEKTKPKTPSIRNSVMRISTDSSTKETEIESSYKNRTKSRKFIIDDTSSDSTFNSGEGLTDIDDKIPNTILIKNNNRIEKIINTQETEIEEEATNNKINETANIVDSNETENNTTEIESINEIQCNSSIVNDSSKSTEENSANCDDSLLARKKLTALNAMVVLTRLESLDDITIDETEFRNANDSSWSNNFSPDDQTSYVSESSDPLEINEDYQSSNCDNSTIDLLSRNIDNSDDIEKQKILSKKSSRSMQILNDDNDTKCSQDTVESDVELSLVWEDNEKSPSNIPDEAQSSGIGESVNTDCIPTENIVIDTNNKNHKNLNDNSKNNESNVKNNVDIRNPKKSSEKRKSIEKLTTNKSDMEKNKETSNTKPKVKKTTFQSKLPKKSRTKILTCSEEPICNVCSIKFQTTQALSEHIYKHSPEEHQEAYKKIKAMMPLESQTSRSIREKSEKIVEKNQEIVNSTIINTEVEKNLENESRVSTLRGIKSKTGSIIPISSKICPCHKDNNEIIDKTDLQIEMVLVCKQCQGLFRRRECFEVHYRTSQQCANDRTLGRLPKLFCANCQLTLESWKNMRHHLVVHASENPEGTVRFVCNICRVVFVGFGALFYNHWFSHLKDSMFVASRYTFPKNSVQPKDGLAKLPIGATADENYIWVAEHVCSKCKKPFSTRPDLELHKKIDPFCNNTTSEQTNKEFIDNNESQWYCDVCNIIFDDRARLNLHGDNHHEHRYTCVSTSPIQKTFMCTKCCAMRKRVKDIEDHWKSDPTHNSIRSDSKNNETTNVSRNNTTIIVPSVNQNQIVDKTISQNVSSNTKNTIENNEIGKITSAKKKIERKDFRNVNDNVFQASVVNSQDKNIIYTNNQESSIGMLRSIEIEKKNTSTTFDNSINRNSTNYDGIIGKKILEKNKTRMRALEDPSVNVVLSDSSSTQLSASLIINESPDIISNNIDNDSITDCYRVLMMDHNPKSTSGPIKMIFGRKNPSNTIENLTEQQTDEISNKSNEIPIEILTDKNNENSSTNESRKTISDADKSEIETNKSVENNNSSNISKNTENNLSFSSLMKNPSESPEIIEIIEEIELSSTNSQVSNSENSSTSCKISPTKIIKGKTNVRCKKSITTKTPRKKSYQENSLNSGMNSSMNMNDSGKSDNSEINTQIRQNSTLSFEEVRYADQILSKINIVDSSKSKKQGFLRVKNLSELQEVKKYSCQICEANFETISCLDEHSRQHLIKSSDKLNKNRKGINAALLLPDSSDITKTSLKNIRQTNMRLPTQSFIPQRIMSIASSGIENANSTNSWIRIENRNQTDSISNSSNLPLLTNYNVNLDTGKNITTTTSNISQIQQNFSNNSQTSNSSLSYIAVPEINRQISDIRNSGQLGYHILPAMVAPSSQNTKQQQQQQTVTNSHQNYSTNNLPISGLTVLSSINQQQINVNKYICSICTTYRCDTLEDLNEHLTKHLFGFNNTNVNQNSPSTNIPTVIVPQASSFRTVNDTVTENITETKSNNDRFVVNNWILHPSINWPNSTFNQQTSTPSTALPITTQPILTTAVQNSTKSNTVWIPQNSNINNKNSSKQSSNEWDTAFTTGEIIGGHVVYQCKICKTAMYSDPEHFRKHVLLVHGIENLLKSSKDNIVQMNYYCRRCPNGMEPFDTAAKLMVHQNTCHDNICNNCNRSFGSYIYLNDHVAHCRINKNHSNFDGNC